MVFTPPETGLGLVRQAELTQRIETILFRWQPRTDDPDGLRMDLYRLVEWALDESHPTCPLLEYTPEGCL